MTRIGKHSFIVALAFCVFMLAGCGGTNATSTAQTPTTIPTTTSTQPSTARATSTSTQASSVSTEQPVPTVSVDQVSSSDIPDTQVFVTYTSSAGKYQLKVPEGWAQTTNGADVSFVSNLDSLQVTLTNASTQPTASSVRNDQAVTLQQTGRAIRDVQVKDVQLPSGPAVLITYTSNSDPNPVTNKQVRLENDRYLFFKNGHLAVLTLSAPVGADNVDQWTLMSRSFQWM